jgi:hypothetical protein
MAIPFILAGPSRKGLAAIRKLPFLEEIAVYIQACT